MPKLKALFILVAALAATAALADDSLKGDTNTTGPFSPSNAGGTTVNTARSPSGDAIYPSQSSAVRARRRGAEKPASRTPPNDDASRSGVGNPGMAPQSAPAGAAAPVGSGSVGR
jgi:hypothetical protein